jgi:hypothetical protein
MPNNTCVSLLFVLHDTTYRAVGLPQAWLHKPLSRSKPVHRVRDICVCWLAA